MENLENLPRFESGAYRETVTGFGATVTPRVPENDKPPQPHVKGTGSQSPPRPLLAGLIIHPKLPQPALAILVQRLGTIKKIYFGKSWGCKYRDGAGPRGDYRLVTAAHTRLTRPASSDGIDNHSKAPSHVQDFNYTSVVIMSVLFGIWQN